MSGSKSAVVPVIIVYGFGAPSITGIADETSVTLFIAAPVLEVFVRQDVLPWGVKLQKVSNT